MGNQGGNEVTAARFDTLIHAPNRLQICALLSAVAEMEFQVLRDHLAVSDSVLSKHIRMLDEADYVSVKKRTRDGRSHTWVSLTSGGRDAFDAHVSELKRIVG